MGSCISKCRPKKISNKEECITPIQIQDKLVISQGAALPLSSPPSKPDLQPPSLSTQSAFSPLSPVSSTSYSCSNNTNNSSSCSSVSSASSCASSSFLNSKGSNELLWSFVKGNNPQNTGNNESIKFPTSKYYAATKKLSTSTATPPPPVVLLAKHQQQHYNRRQQRQVSKLVAPQKRPRAASPSPSNLTRQKSFRRDQETLNSTPSNRNLRSPSPSRRFSGGGGISANTPILQETRHNTSKRYTGKVVDNGKGSSNIYASLTSGTVQPSSKSKNSYGKQERLVVRPSSPNNSKGFGSSRLTISGSSSTGSKETSVTTTSVGSSTSTAACRTRSGTHEHEDGKMDIISNHTAPEEMDWMPSEDIDNPLISLDCFIFL